MTTTATLYPSTVASTAGSTWTTTGNATGSTAGTVATFTNAASGGVGSIQLSGYSAQGALPSGVTVASVAVNVASYEAVTSRWTSATVQLYSGTTPIGSAQALTLSATTTNSQTVTFTGANAPTYAQCADLRVQVTATHSGTTSSTFNLDTAGLTVTYTVALPYTENWPGSDGSALPAVWTETLGAATIQAGKARLTGAAAGTYGTARRLLSMPATSDVEVAGTVDFTTATSNEQYAFLYLRHNGVWGANAWDPQQAYVLRLIPGLSGTSDVILQRYSGGSPTTVWSSTDGPVNFAGEHKVKAVAAGAVVRIKFWPVGAAEPLGWTATYTDSSPLPAGVVGMAAVNGNNATARPIDFGPLTVTAPSTSTTAPTPPAVPNTIGTPTYERTTAGGTDVFKYQIQPDGVTTGTPGQAYLYVPGTRPVGSTAKVIISCHGHNESAQTFMDVLGFGGAKDLTDVLLDAGYVMIVPQFDATFGNSDAQARITRARTYLYANWSVTGLVLLGFSMGGGAAAIAWHRRTIPAIRAVQLIAPALNFVRLGGPGATYDVVADLDAAYGTNQAGLGVASAAYDPWQQSPSKFAGGRFRVVSSSADEYALRPDATTFLSNIAPYATEAVDVDSSTALHGDYGQWANPLTTVAWLDNAIANPVATAQPLRLGSSALTDIRIGSSAVSRVYLGATPVWP